MMRYHWGITFQLNLKISSPEDWKKDKEMKRNEVTIGVTSPP